MRILVTGSKGQLGTDLAVEMAEGNELFCFDAQDMDITNLDTTVAKIKDIKPAVILNLAGYTNVDLSETNQDLAFQVNAIGARNLAIGALETDARLLSISTDYVFDGRSKVPYIEFDQTNPVNIYGKSKLAGEDMIRQIWPKHYILRTAWLFGSNGANFVKTMLNLGGRTPRIPVVDDQIGSPTYTLDLIDGIKKILASDGYGTYHATNEGSCSWNEFAKKIFEYAGKENVTVESISTEQFARPADRPRYSVLHNYMLELQFDYRMRSWEDALREFLLKENKSI